MPGLVLLLKEGRIYSRNISVHSREDVIGFLVTFLVTFTWI